jgi:hypothetical protein
MADLRISISRKRGARDRPTRLTAQAAGKKPWRVFPACGAFLILLAGLQPSNAAELGTIGGFVIRLDTTTRLSLGLRTDGQEAALLQNPNTDDGDRAFAPGIVSERVDFTSVLDATRGDLGVEISTDGWYDAIYHQADANHHGSTFNPVDSPVDHFPPGTQRLLGGTAELGTAYVHDRFELAGTPVTIRLGRQSLLWGESLFFPQDGIAAGQAPVDEIKALSQPLVEDQEVFLPVDQAYLRADLGGGASLEGYEQLEWRRDRAPAVGSYFSSNDIADVGGQRVFLANGKFLFRIRDGTPGDFGQFGVALRYASDVADLGLYALRFDSKQGVVQANDRAYHLVFPRGIDTIGTSISTYLGDSTLSGEVSVRQHMPLVSTGLIGVSQGVGPTAPQPSVGPAGNSYACPALAPCRASQPNATGYATGQVLLALASYERQLPTGRLWQGGTLDVELSSTQLVRIESNGADRLPHTTRWSSAVQAVFAPQYFHVLPQLDLIVPVGLQWGLSGRSSVDAGQIARVGNITVSLSATYRSVWQMGLSFTHFLGPAIEQPLADRDFLTLSLGRTF